MILLKTHPLLKSNWLLVLSDRLCNYRRGEPCYVVLPAITRATIFLRLNRYCARLGICNLLMFLFISSSLTVVRHVILGCHHGLLLSWGILFRATLASRLSCTRRIWPVNCNCQKLGLPNFHIEQKAIWSMATRWIALLKTINLIFRLCTSIIFTTEDHKRKQIP